jgi:hypothetical protein
VTVAATPIAATTRSVPDLLGLLSFAAVSAHVNHEPFGISARSIEPTAPARLGYRQRFRPRGRIIATTGPPASPTSAERPGLMAAPLAAGGLV